MRKITLGFAALAIAFTALALGANTAKALDFSITFGTGQPPIVRHHDQPRGLPVTPYTHRPVVPHRQAAPHSKAAPHRKTAPPPRYDHRPHWRDQRSNWRDNNRYDRRDRRDRRWHDDRRHGSQSCTVRTERYWDGRGWVTERRRVCR